MSVIRNQSWFKKHFVPFFSNYTNQKELINDFTKSEGPAGDYIWSLFNRILQQVAKSFQQGKIEEVTFYKHNANIYREMSNFLLNHEKKSALHIQSLYQYNTLKEAQCKFSNLQGFEVFSVNCCKPCDSFYQKKLTIDEALEHAQKIPERCLNGRSCRVTYFPIVPEDPDSPIKIKITYG